MEEVDEQHRIVRRIDKRCLYNNVLPLRCTKMTDREIRKYIDQLNKGKANETIFTRIIEKNVVVAKVWSKQPKINDDYFEKSLSFRFFFIKNDTNEYVGAVLDMISDLHWYVIPRERKKGYLSRALRGAVLPYLFYERDAIRVTINKNRSGNKHYFNSKKVAIKVGFKPLNDIETIFELCKKDYNWDFENLNERNTNFSMERAQELKSRVFLSSKILFQISDELLMAFNDDEDLKSVASQVHLYIDIIGELAKKNRV